MSPVLLGQQTPRFQLAPPCLHNAVGDDAVEFGRRIGVPLDPWQQLGIGNGLGVREGGAWAAFEVCVICQRQNGKGSITDVVELYALFVLGLPVIIHSAHRLDTSRKAFRVIKGIIERNPDLARRCHPINDSDEHIETIGGCRLEFRTRTRSGGRGLTCDLLVLDEALELTDEQIAAIVPTLAARPNAQIWYTSTVPQSAEQHLCKVRASARLGAPRLAYVEWGVDKGSTTAETARILADPVAHAAANPAYGRRLTAERLDDLRRILGDVVFATECMGIWPDESTGAVLDPARWRLMLDPDSRRDDGADLALAVDVTPMRDHASIGMYSLRADGREHMQLVDYRPGTDWLVDRIVELRQVLNPICIAYDAKNGAHALLPDLAECGIVRPRDREEWDQEPKRGDLLELDTPAAVDAVGQFIDGFRAPPLDDDRPRYAHLGQGPLDTAVRGAGARSVGDAGQIAWARRASEVDIGPLQVITEARYGYHLWVDVVRDDYDLMASVF
nr:hypothetical protein [Micromonospora sp. DSM 115978]